MIAKLLGIKREVKDSITDLTPRGIRSTFKEEQADFNSTFIHIYNQIKNK